MKTLIEFALRHYFMMLDTAPLVMFPNTFWKDLPFKHLTRSRFEEKIHEKITVDIIQTDPEICDILTPEERDFVVDIIQGQEAWDWKRDIVSSELDADKMDYLLRDSYFTGVKYGEYDLEKVVESFSY